MTIDFDTPIDRAGTASLKYDARQQYFASENIIPLWVADMDFAAPAAISEALVKRAQHGVHGYSTYPESLYHSLQHWFSDRHGWQIEREHIVLCPGVVPSLYALVTTLTDPGEAVIIQPPVYQPFFTAITETGRQCIENPLQIVNGQYEMDFSHLITCAQAGAKVLLLCSPHNPVGRVWDKATLTRLCQIAEQYQITIVSDEIHADLCFPGQVHQPLAALAADKANIITAISPSKTFNIPGLGLSAVVISDTQQRTALQKTIAHGHNLNMNPFSIVGFEAGYRHGAAWLDELMPYLANTKQWVTQYCQQMIPAIKVMRSEGTYLLWLACHDLGLDDLALQRFFIEKAGLGLSPGTLFGTEQGTGFMRLNIAAPFSIIQRAMQQLATAVNERIG